MHTAKDKILIIEDDASLVFLLTKLLESLHMKVEYSYTGQLGKKMALSNKYSLIIIDIGLPDISGFEVVKEIRNVNNKPIIVITGDNTDEIELESYKLRVDIFHSKPIKFEIFQAQIISILKNQKTFEIIKSKDIYVDIRKRIFKRNKKNILLTKTEFDFLVMLFNSNGEVFSREKIISNVMNYYSTSSFSCVDTLVSRVRNKLGNNIKDSIIKTVNKSGYCLNPSYLKSIERIR